jgi:hypothetical protein
VELTKSRGDGVGTAIHGLLRGEGGSDENDAIRLGRGGWEVGEDFDGQGASQGGEAENSVAVEAQEELDEAVAETTDAVVKEDRAACDCEVFGLSHLK